MNGFSKRLMVRRWNQQRGAAACVREFHETFGAPIAHKPGLLEDYEVGEFRHDLLLEEVGELRDAILEQDLIEIADALGDIVYIAYGTALTYGLDLDEILAEVHRSNMTKLGSDGQPLIREDGKVIKGPNFEQPKLAEVLFGYGAGSIDEAS